jgi:hypothetical protein
MIKKAMWVGLVLSVLGFMPAAVSAAAQMGDNKTTLTFSQPVEVPGHVLPAGTYTFKLADSMSDRHIVQIFNADESQLIATIMAIPGHRLTRTDETVIRFTETPRGAPQAIRAWFYPGDIVGQAFVYPRDRAAELAKVTGVSVPAVTVDIADTGALTTAPIVSVTADAREVPVTAAVQPAPARTLPEQPTAAPTAQSREPVRELPRTASSLPLIMLFGLLSLGLAIGLMAFGRYARRSAA